MALTEKAMKYARQHPQDVRLCWLDQHTTSCRVLEAVALCSIPHVAASIVGAVADDKTMEALLNRLVDGE